MNRRNLLTGASMLALVACTTTITPSQLQTDADLITNGVTLFAPAVSLKASAAQQAIIANAVSAVQAADKALATATGQQLTLNVTTIVQDVQAIAPIAIALLPGGSVEALAASAALALLPELLSAIGVVTTPPKTAAARITMEPRAARAILRGIKE